MTFMEQKIFKVKIQETQLLYTRYKKDFEREILEREKLLRRIKECEKDFLSMKANRSGRHPDYGWTLTIFSQLFRFSKWSNFQIGPISKLVQFTNWSDFKIGPILKLVKF